MGQGQGSITSSPQATPPAGTPGPPFPLNSANSGLHVDAITGIIQLGSNLGANPLLQDTFIEQGTFPGFQFGVTRGGNRGLFINNLGTAFDFGDIDSLGGSYIQLDSDPGAGVNFFRYFQRGSTNPPLSIGIPSFPTNPDDVDLHLTSGDLNTGFVAVQELITGNVKSQMRAGDGTNQMQYEQDAAAQTHKMSAFNGFRFEELAPAAGTYEIGDIDSFLNQSKLRIDDTTQQIFFSSGGDPYFSISVNSKYQFGDISSVLNGSFIKIDDTNQFFQFISSPGGTGERFLNLDVLTQLYQIGDIDSTGNGSQISISDAVPNLVYSMNGIQYLGLDGGAGQTMSFGNAATGLIFQLSANVDATILNLTTGQQAMDLNLSTNSYKIGDIAAINNSTLLNLDDASQVIAMSIGSGPLNTLLELDFPNKTYRIGDINANNNNTTLTVEDTNARTIARGDQNISFNGAALEVDSLQADTAILIGAINPLRDNASGAVPTLGINGPVAGPPNKWIAISDGGIAAYIPVWQ